MQTTRLLLEPFAPTDSEALLALFRDPHVRRYLLDDTLVDAEWVAAEIDRSRDRFAAGQPGLFAARWRPDGDLVGFVGLRPFAESDPPQLIYGLLPNFVGRGLAREMARAVIDATFLLHGQKELHAVVDAPNLASIRLLRALGFSESPPPPGPAFEQIRFVLPRLRYSPTIRTARPDDAPSLRQIHCAAFGRPAEADLVAALYAEGYVVVSLVAALGDEPIAHILFTELPLRRTDGSGVVRGLALAPVAVRPDVQRQGLGAALITAGLEHSHAAGAAVVVVLGHAEYYPRFGFRAELARAISAPWSGRSFMALELAADALAGSPLRAEYAAPFLR